MIQDDQGIHFSSRKWISVLQLLKTQSYKRNYGFSWVPCWLPWVVKLWMSMEPWTPSRFSKTRSIQFADRLTNASQSSTSISSAAKRNYSLQSMAWTSTPSLKSSMAVDSRCKEYSCKVLKNGNCVMTQSMGLQCSMMHWLQSCSSSENAVRVLLHEMKLAWCHLICGSNLLLFAVVYIDQLNLAIT